MLVEIVTDGDPNLEYEKPPVGNTTIVRLRADHITVMGEDIGRDGIRVRLSRNQIEATEQPDSSGARKP